MDQIKINFRLKYATLIVGTLLTVIAVAFAWQNLQSNQDLISIFASGIALTALTYTAINSNYTAKMGVEQLRLKRLENAMLFIESSSSSEQIAAIQIGMVLREEVRGKDANYIRKVFEENPQKKQAIILILNYFERLGIVVRMGVADETMLREYFQGVVKRYWHSFCPWILDLRAQVQDPNLMKELEMLTKKWG